jgi:hypothetical protein
MQMEVSRSMEAGNYSLENGAFVSITKGAALDYSLMRSSQLSALLNAMQVPGFSQCSSEIQSDCVWLAQSLSDEIKHLFEIVAADKK